jgi:glutathione S-transferase
MRRMVDGPYIFYGLQLSLYAGKVRSYLRKKQLPFVERETWHPGFADASAKVATQKQPLVVTPEGEVLQDTTEIIDFLEARHPEHPVYPEGPVQRLVALLFELYGDEGLMKPAMHYRWNFPEQNDRFLMAEFGRGQLFAGSSSDDGLGGWTQLQTSMRTQLLPLLGVTPESAPAIEAAYEDLLDRLEEHFRSHPYLLGGRPSIGDFGMLAPLYAHLGRDPYPLELMKARAPSCHRWVERMNVADAGLAEFPDCNESYLPLDEIPESLLPILALMAQDYMHELLSIVAFVDEWIARQPELPAGTPFPASTQAMGTLSPIGHHRVTLRGVEIELAVQHYSIWMLQRVLDHYHALDSAARQGADAVLDSTGLAPLLRARPVRRIERIGFTEVLG